jgi:hypothetical protein
MEAIITVENKKIVAINLCQQRIQCPCNTLVVLGENLDPRILLAVALKDRMCSIPRAIVHAQALPTRI